MVISYRRFGLTFRSHLEGAKHLKMGQLGWRETSVRDHHYSPRKKTEERSSVLNTYLLTRWLYDPLRPSAVFITDAHISLSTAFCRQLLTVISRTSCSVSSNRLKFRGYLRLLCFPWWMVGECPVWGVTAERLSCSQPNQHGSATFPVPLKFRVGFSPNRRLCNT